MYKKIVSGLLLTLLLLGPSVQTTVAQQTTSAEEVKTRVVRIGVGEKAKATVTTKDGTKIKGYISQSGDTDFVIRDRKTNSPTTIKYADVVKVDRDHGHSRARNILIGVGIGAGAVLLAIFIAIARAD